MSEIDVRAAALAHLRSLPRDRLSLVTMRQLKRGLEGDLKLTEGSLDEGELGQALRECAPECLELVQNELSSKGADDDAPLGDQKPFVGIKRDGPDSKQPQQQQQQQAPKRPRANILPETAASKAGGVDGGAALPAPNSEGAYVWELDDPLLKASVKTFKGMVLIDFRKFYVDKNSGEVKPTSKGVSLKPEQWESLKARIKEIDAAVAKFG